MKILRRNLVLKFKTADDTTIDLTILKPKEGLDPLDIKDAMDVIVASGAYGMSTQANAVIGAQYDIRQVEEITLS